MIEKAKKEANAVQVIKCAWNSWVIAEKQRQKHHYLIKLEIPVVIYSIRKKVREESIAVTTIQTNWKNYRAKVSVM